MTRNEVIVQAIAKKLTWIQAADICGITERQMRRLKPRYERYGYAGRSPAVVARHGWLGVLSVA